MNYIKNTLTNILSTILGYVYTAEKRTFSSIVAGLTDLAEELEDYQAEMDEAFDALDRDIMELRAQQNEAAAEAYSAEQAAAKVRNLVS